MTKAPSACSTAPASFSEFLVIHLARLICRRGVLVARPTVRLDPNANGSTSPRPPTPVRVRQSQSVCFSLPPAERLPPITPTPPIAPIPSNPFLPGDSREEAGEGGRPDPADGRGRCTGFLPGYGDDGRLAQQRDADPALCGRVRNGSRKTDLVDHLIASLY